VLPRRSRLARSHCLAKTSIGARRMKRVRGMKSMKRMRMRVELSLLERKTLFVVTTQNCSQIK